LGGTLDAIHHTILYGVRSGHAEARFNEMPASGLLGMLTREAIDALAEYVLFFAGEDHDPTLVERGGVLFAEQCTVCHGEDGTGIEELGAPNLTDQIWLYGGIKRAIVIHAPRHGVMPAWTGRLDPVTIKSVAIDVHALGGGQ